MNIIFECKTNMPKEPVMINTVTFYLKNGSYITVDRDETEVDVDRDGTFDMTWKGCYLWNINDCNIFGDNGYHINDADAIEEFKSLVGNVITAEFEVEDDAAFGYMVEPVSFSVS